MEITVLQQTPSSMTYIVDHQPYTFSLLSQDSNGAMWFCHTTSTKMYLPHYGDAEKEASPKKNLGDGTVTSPLAGTLLSILVTPGQQVSPTQKLLVIESMKMENDIHAPIGGIIEKIHVQSGATLSAHQVLITITPLKPSTKQ